MPSVLLATQSMADVKESPIASTILQSTATKIYLPNSEAGNESMRQFYDYAGLNSREIEMLQRALPKRDYYVVHPPWTKRSSRFVLGRSRSLSLACLPAKGSGSDRRLGEAIRRTAGSAAWMREKQVSKEWIDYYEGGSRHAKKWLAKGTSAVAIVALIATATAIPTQAHAGGRVCLQPNIPSSSIMQSWSANLRSKS